MTEQLENEFARNYGSSGMVSSKSLDSPGWVGS